MSNFINVGSYEKFCDRVFDGKRAPAEDCIVYCSTDETLNFFKACKSRKNKYIVVSACSDFGINYQSEHHPNSDLKKTINRIDWQEIEKVRDQYVNINLISMIQENCRNSDFYSVKVDSLTHHTFTEIPENVMHWYSTNVNVVHPKITMIPFGVNDQGHGYQIVEKYNKPLKDKENKLYVNFQDYTIDRIRYKAHFKRFEWVTYHDKVGLHVDKFYEELSNHKFVLCPFGNGLDSYRLYETLIVGSIPVMQESVFTTHLVNMGLPIVTINNFLAVGDSQFEQLKDLYEKQNFEFKEGMLDKIKEDYWKKELTEAKNRYIIRA